jgi:tetratricopeptide (TPR) repeat protein
MLTFRYLFQLSLFILLLSAQQPSLAKSEDFFCNATSVRYWDRRARPVQYPIATYIPASTLQDKGDILPLIRIPTYRLGAVLPTWMDAEQYNIDLWLDESRRNKRRQLLPEVTPCPSSVEVVGTMFSPISWEALKRSVQIPLAHGPLLFFESAREGRLVAGLFGFQPTWTLVFLPRSIPWSCVPEPTFCALAPVPALYHPSTRIESWYETAFQLRDKVIEEYKRGNYKEAARISQGLVDVDERRTDVPDQLKLFDRCALVSCSVHLNRFTEARHLFADIDCIDTKKADRDYASTIARMLRTTALSYANCEDYRKAERLFQLAFELDKRQFTYGFFNSYYGTDLIGIALAQAGQSRFTDSINTFRRASKELGVIFGDEETADCLNRFGRLMSSTGYKTEAAESKLMETRIRKYREQLGGI